MISKKTNFVAWHVIAKNFLKSILSLGFLQTENSEREN